MKKLILLFLLAVCFAQAQTPFLTRYGLRIGQNGAWIDTALVSGDSLRFRVGGVWYSAYKNPVKIDTLFHNSDTSATNGIASAAALRDTAAQLRASIGGGSMTKQQIINSLNASIPDTIGLTRPLTVNKWVGFNGPNSGSAVAGVGDSVQVTVSDLRAGALIVASYNSNAPLTTSSIPVSVGNVQTSFFTIFADEGKTVTYWIMTGNLVAGGDLRLLFHSAGPYVMGDSVGIDYGPKPGDSILVFQAHFSIVIPADSGGFAGVLFGLQDGDDTDDSLKSVLWYNDTGSERTIDTTIQIVLFKNKTSGTVVFKPFAGNSASTLSVSDAYLYAGEGASGIYKGLPAVADDIARLYLVPPLDFSEVPLIDTISTPIEAVMASGEDWGVPVWTMSHTVSVIYSGIDVWSQEGMQYIIACGTDLIYRQTRKVGNFGSFTKLQDDSSMVYRRTVTWSIDTVESDFFGWYDVGVDDVVSTFTLVDRYNPDTEEFCWTDTVFSDFVGQSYRMMISPFLPKLGSAYLVNGSATRIAAMSPDTTVTGLVLALRSDENWYNDPPSTVKSSITIEDPTVEIARPVQKKEFIYTKKSTDSILVATVHVHGSSAEYTHPYGTLDNYFKGIGMIFRFGNAKYSYSFPLDSAAWGVDSVLQIRIPLDTMTVGRTDTVRLKFFAYDSLDVLQVFFPYVTIIKKVSDLLLDFEQLPERYKNPLWRKGELV